MADGEGLLDWMEAEKKRKREERLRGLPAKVRGFQDVRDSRAEERNPFDIGDRPNPFIAQIVAEGKAREKSEARRRRLAAGGARSTVRTSQMGLLSEAPTKKKTLLGG